MCASINTQNVDKETEFMQKEPVTMKKAGQTKIGQQQSNAFGTTAVNLENQQLIEKIEAMLAVSSYESILTERMIREMFFSYEDMKEKYERLKTTAFENATERFKETNLKEIINNKRKINALEQGVDFFDSWIDLAYENSNETDVVNELNMELKQKFEKLLYRNLAEQKRKLTEAKHDLQEYVELVDWFENRDKDIKNILENSTGANVEEDYETLRYYILNEDDARPRLKLNRDM